MAIQLAKEGVAGAVGMSRKMAGGPLLPRLCQRGVLPGVQGAGVEVPSGGVLRHPGQVRGQVSDAPARTGWDGSCEGLSLDPLEQGLKLLEALFVGPGRLPARPALGGEHLARPEALGERVEELRARGPVGNQPRVDGSGTGGGEPGSVVGPLEVLRSAVCPPGRVVLESLAACQRGPDVPALGQRVPDALRGHRVLEQAGVAGERPSRSVRLALEAAQHRLRHGDHVGDLLCPVEQSGVERRREPAQHRQVRRLTLGSGSAGQLRRAGDIQEVHAVLAGRRHQCHVLVDVDVAPVRVGKSLPVGKQHRHLALPLPGTRKSESSGDRGGSAVGADDPASLDVLATPEDDSTDGIVGRPGPEQVVHLAAGPELRARLDGGLHEHRVQRDPPDRHGPVVVADRRECSGHSVPQDPPAVLDRAQHVGGAEPVTRAELIEQVQRVRKQLVRRNGVAGKGVAVHQQHPLTGAGEQRGHGRAGARGRRPPPRRTSRSALS